MGVGASGLGYEIAYGDCVACYHFGLGLSSVSLHKALSLL